MPTRIYGIPGVAVFDFDNDSDLDLYVSNGPGRENSLYSNQLVESGQVFFLDVAQEAGVDAKEQDSTGVCFGDLDNDFDTDLFVLGRSEANRLFENRGDGTFSERFGHGLEGGSSSSVSCSMGDIDGDGLLDIVVANTFDYESLLAIFAEPFALNHSNQLFRNRGDGTFEDVSEPSGILEVGGLPPGVATISWATAMVDVDRDGDTDIVFADDQGGIPIARDGGLDRGYLHVFLNDGAGSFSDRPVILDEVSSGSWMGLAFGDLDCDGALDLLGSNFGDYNIPSLGNPYLLGDQATRWFFGRGDGSFSEPGLGSSVSSAFGWGNAVFDYDNDGDQDLLYHGSLDLNFTTFADNPGVLLENRDCGADFRLVDSAFATDYQRRNVQGVAIGDLNRDGFVDVVTASNFLVPDHAPLVPSPAVYGGPLDSTAALVPVFFPVPEGFVWSGLELDRGTLTVEAHSGEGGRSGVTIQPVGGVGVTPRGAVNRSGFGAVVEFRPKGLPAVLMPIVGGSSLASQNAPEAYFGLGPKHSGVADILWPGGTKNRLYGVRSGERIVFPEIPCSYDSDGASLRPYLRCVQHSLSDWQAAGVIDSRTRFRFMVSAILAFFER